MKNKTQLYIILIIFSLLVTITYHAYYLPLSYIDFAFNQSILKISPKYNSYHLYPLSFVNSQILKILQKKIFAINPQTIYLILIFVVKERYSPTPLS